MYCNKFFETREDALKFRKEHGGVLYSNTTRSKTKDAYMVEARMMGKTEEFRNKHPFVVAWNEV